MKYPHLFFLLMVIVGLFFCVMSNMSDDTVGTILSAIFTLCMLICYNFGDHFMNEFKRDAVHAVGDGK